MKTAVILNAPPGAGKDTIADLMAERGYTKRMFKTQLYKETAGYYQVDYDELVERATDRDLKEQPWIDGESPRDMLINTSEGVIKPAYGDAFFGVMASLDCIDGNDKLTVFSDGGFVEELIPLTEYFDLVIVCRLFRDGFSFVGDSRQYLNPVDERLEGIAIHDINLYPGEPERALAAVQWAVDIETEAHEWLKQAA